MGDGSANCGLRIISRKTKFAETMKANPSSLSKNPAIVNDVIDTPIKIGIAGVHRNLDANGEGTDSVGSPGAMKYRKKTAMALI
jgi:hypothetical protein